MEHSRPESNDAYKIRDLEEVREKLASLTPDEISGGGISDRLDPFRSDGDRDDYNIVFNYRDEDGVEKDIELRKGIDQIAIADLLRHYNNLIEKLKAS